MKWLSDSGMKVNASKTEMVVFGSRNFLSEITVNNNTIKASNNIKILGVIFDRKLQWNEQINATTSKCQKFAYGLKILQKYFTETELLNVVTSIGFSKLYYGGPVWLSRSLHNVNMRKLLRASALMIKACSRSSDLNLISFEDMHIMSGKPNPKMMSDYIQATTLKSIYQNCVPELVWLKLQENVRYNERTNKMTFGTNGTVPGAALNFGNRIQHVSQKLPTGWETMTKISFKNSAKTLFKIYRQSLN